MTHRNAACRDIELRPDVRHGRVSFISEREGRGTKNRTLHLVNLLARGASHGGSFIFSFVHLVCPVGSTSVPSVLHTYSYRILPDVKTSHRHRGD